MKSTVEEWNTVNMNSRLTNPIRLLAHLKRSTANRPP